MFELKEAIEKKGLTMKVVDSLQNLLTGLGLSSMDKTTASEWVEISLTDVEKENAFSNDWLVNKACETPPFDMVRNWIRYEGDMDDDKQEQFKKKVKSLNVRDKIQEAMTWARVYGGGVVIINVNDGKDPSEPLELDNIKQGSLQFLNVADRQYFHALQANHNALDSNFGFPDVYKLAFGLGGNGIHYTRIIRFDGKKMPYGVRKRNQYWGKSIIEVMYNAFMNASSSQENISALIYEAVVDVVKVPDLMEKTANKEDTEALQKRFGLAKLMKSVNRMLLIDSEEEIEQKTVNFAGIKDIIPSFLNIVAGAADIPVTRLLGQSPGGLNSTGESDLNNYYDFINAQQEVILKPKLEYLFEIIYRSEFGKEPDNNELDFEFNELWRTTDAEQANIEFVKAQRDDIYLANNVITEDVVAKELMNDGTYSAIDADYIADLEKEMEEDDFGSDDDLPLLPTGPSSQQGNVAVTGENQGQDGNTQSKEEQKGASQSKQKT